jgi:hypothetical protein
MPEYKEDRPVVKLVGHAFLLCCVGLDVDNISNTIGNKIGRDFDVAMFYASQDSFFMQSYGIHTFKARLEHMTRTRPVTERVRHFW